MATVRVKPSGSQWRVTKGGVTKSNHRKKSRAKQKARRVANSGDTLVVFRKNGTIQSRGRVR